MVHILMISEEFSPYQPTPTRVSTLARMIARLGHRVILLSNSGRLVEAGPLSSLLKNLMPTETCVERVTWIFPPVFRTGSARGLVRAVEGLLSVASTLVFGVLLLLPRASRVEVVYSSTAQSQGFMASLLKSFLRLPLIVNYGDPAFVRDTGMVRVVEQLFEKVTLSKANLVVATDPVVARFVSEKYGRTAILLPNGYDADLFRATAHPAAVSSSCKIITFVGKMDLSIYRLDVLLNAMVFLKDRFPTVRLRLIGYGPDMTRLKSHVRRLGLQKNLEFVGLVPHHDVPRWLAESDVCVHITNDMCTGVKVSEYMAAKKPVVIAAPWWNRYPEFLENGVNCIMVPLVPEEVASAFAELLMSPSTADRIAENGFKTVLPWTWEAIARKKIALIEELIQRHAS